MNEDALPADTAPPPDAYDARSEARRLLRTARSGTLATLTRDGEPYASLAALATLPDGSFVVPLSTLAVHTRHVADDPRCSLLIGVPGAGDPMAHPRLTLSCRAVKAEDGERDAWRARFLRRHPDAFYVDFGDFSFWRLAIRGGRMIGGFGRINMLKPADLSTDLAGAEALVAAETRAVDHMNQDHRDATRLYATRLAGAPDGDWRITGLDPDGLDLACGDDARRLAFHKRITDSGALRELLVQWVEKARTMPLEA